MASEPYNGPYYVDKADKQALAELSKDIKSELNDQGFPGYMCYSFLATARVTNSIILSRLPGGVGNDLIKVGYDLKGFHIKAKSCNWGPMAGFICQLPVFNKLGIDKVSYNTNEIGHYLSHLKKFSGTKAKIDAEEAKRIAELRSIDPRLPKDELIAKKSAINKKYDGLILNALKSAREMEAKSGEWTGENAIRADTPFIPLKRAFPSIIDLEKMRGVIQVEEIQRGQLIYGLAHNVTDDDVPENNNPSVITEFLLVADGRGLWDIYHGRIKYKNDPNRSQPFDQSFEGKVITAKVEKKVIEKYKAEIDKIFDFDRSSTHETAKDVELEKMVGKGAYATLFPRLSKATFYRVRGFVNPFPPFGTQEYYKNAVSGDYDLFAIWPSMKVSEEELIRQSELTTGRYNRIGGKIFTTYFGNKYNLGVEFIPGFKELNPDKDGIPILKESAEFGNMNSLVHLVSGRLNSFAASFIAEINNLKSNANKGFHSDEGGRPGIMEIEFPIAVFMPEEFRTKVLNNKDPEPGLKIPKVADRGEIKTFGGLIKSPDELVEFILECMTMKYRVFLHYRWLIHLLYNTLNTANYDAVLWEIFEDNKAEIGEFIADFNPGAPANVKDFKAINANRVIIDRKMEYDIDAYRANIKRMLTYPDEASNFIKKLTEKMMVYSLLGDKLSFDKKNEVEDLMNTVRINTLTA